MPPVSRTLAFLGSLALAGALLAGCGPAIKDSAPAAGAELAPGKQVGDMTLKGLDGQSVQFKSLVGGKVALVDLWATWCAPCVAEMPHLQAIHNQYKDRNFTVLGIMIDDNASRIGPDFLKKQPVSYPMVMDDGAAAVQQQVGSVDGIPLLVLLDRDGKVVRVFQGYTDENKLKDAIETEVKKIEGKA